MDPETTTEGDIDTSSNDVEQVETISITKKDYETLNQTLGSLKREIKDLKKPKDTPQPTDTKPEAIGLVQKTFLRAAQITHPEDVEFALATAKKWGVELDTLVDDTDFQVKLERQRTQRSNAEATSNIRGGAGTNTAKNTPEYWIAKGTPPSATDVPDRKARVKIARAMIANATTSKKFYND